MTYEELKQKFVDPDHFERRKIIIDEMNSLAEIGQGCLSCEGFCCTYSYNSMQVTPLEALDSYVYLRENGLLNSDTIERIKDTIKRFRLDVEISLGGKEMRKNYTCPFYKHQSKGCSISRKYKPYGCLGFNALKKNVSTEGHCASNVKILTRREEQFNEEDLNNFLKQELELYWNKKNYPIALLTLIEKLG